MIHGGIFLIFGKDCNLINDQTKNKLSDFDFHFSDSNTTPRRGIERS